MAETAESEPRAARRDGAPTSAPLVVVTGKGGVGKSTVAAALGLAAARDGARVLVVEVAARSDVAATLRADDGAAPVYVQRPVAPGVDQLSIDPQHALNDYVRRQLPRPLAALLLHNRLFSLLTAATPGLAELLTIGKVWQLTAQPDHDLVILDAPATGHAVALLHAPRTFSTAAGHGPIAHQAERIDADLRDPDRTSYVVVATAEEMAVTETIQLAEQLRGTLGIELHRVVVNALFPDRFSAADVRALTQAPPGPARHAALFAAGRARHQRGELRRLHAELAGIDVVRLPFVFEPRLGPDALERLADVLHPDGAGRS